jgi:hypothetical protein
MLASLAVLFIAQNLIFGIHCPSGHCRTIARDELNDATYGVAPDGSTIRRARLAFTKNITGKLTSSNLQVFLLTFTLWA